MKKKLWQIFLFSALTLLLALTAAAETAVFVRDGGNGDGTGNACFVGSGGLSDLLMLTGACADTLYEAFRQAGAPADIARKLMLIAVLGADPHGHADSIQTLDLDARREIRDMAAELGVDADF